MPQHYYAQKRFQLNTSNSFNFCVASVCRLQDQDLTPHTSEQLRKALGQYFSTSSFVRNKCGNTSIEPVNPSTQYSVTDSTVPKLFLIPSKNKDDSPCALSESYISTLWKLRNQVSLSSLSLSPRSDTHTHNKKNVIMDTRLTYGVKFHLHSFS